MSAEIFSVAATTLAPLLGLLVITAIIVSVLATGGPGISMDPLMPKLQKLNPIEVLNNLISVKGMIEVVKSILKMIGIVIIATSAIRGSLAALVQLPSCGLSCSPPLLRAKLLPLVGSSVLLFLIFGRAYLALQRWLFMRDQRMSLTEKKNERKNTEGNPQIRSARRRHRREASQMKAGMNPAFIVTGSGLAVAMRYSSVDAKVPMLVARAEGDDLAEFLQDARMRKLQMVHDSTTARTLFDTVEIGKTIPSALFQAIINRIRQIDTSK